MACKLAPGGLAQVQAGTLSAAYATLQKMQREEANCTDTVGFKAAAEARLAKAQALYGQFATLLQARKKADGCEVLTQQAMVEWTDSPDFEKAKTQYCRSPVVPGQCVESLAGYGSKSRAACYDTLDGGTRGPTMVVIPAGGDAAKPFAIGKYEVSVADYNTYCKLSGKCPASAGGNPSMPVTGISLKDAEAYAAWLTASNKDKAKYRLPTGAEWEHAANANGALPSQSDFNCRVESGGNVIKGLGLVDAQSGAPNGWGLINFVGNAQEWVTGSGGVAARGGAFEDPLTRCGVTFSKPHNGNADPVTSFRLVRELG